MRAIFMISSLAAVLFAGSASANECEMARQAGTIKSYVGLAQCIDRLDARTQQGQYGDLLQLLSMRRIAIAKKMDKRQLSEAEGFLQIQAAVVEFTTAAQQRAAYAQTNQPQGKSMVFCNTLGFSTVCY